MIITSPPYWNLRDYGRDNQLGLEQNFNDYIMRLCNIFDEGKRILKDSGTLWVNISDSFNNFKQGNTNHLKYAKGCQDTYIKQLQPIPKKTLCQIPARFAIEMINRGWCLRNEIIWYKPNAMPESVKNRFTIDYEKLYFFVKNEKYYFAQQKEAMKTKDLNRPRGSKGVIGEQNSGRRKQDDLNKATYSGFNTRYVPHSDYKRNKRSVWSISTSKNKFAHFATFPEQLINIPIQAGCPQDGIVLDCFMGSGTTAVACKKLNRNYIGIELNSDYCKIAEERLNNA